MGQFLTVASIVDDDNSIREFLTQILETAGYSVTGVDSGEAALVQVRTKRPDLIVLDVMMPGMSGFDVAAALKNDPATKDMPIIILSVVGNEKRGYQIGIDSYLTKPIDPEILLRKIEALVIQGVSKKKVMIVDENVPMVKTLSDILQAKGYTVLEVYKGEECLEKARGEKPDMIIIDTSAPGHQDIIKTLKLEKGLENVYFIILSGGKEIDEPDKS